MTAPRATPKKPAPNATLGGFPTHVRIKPLSFIGREGSVEIWQIENFLRPEDPGRFMIAAYARRKNNWVGTLDLIEASTMELDRGCAMDVAELGRRYGTSTSHVLRVNGASIEPAYRGIGLGSAMYVAGAAMARKMNYALAADACFDSATSESARRIWQTSRFFREAADVGRESSLVAVLRGGSRAGMVSGMSEPFRHKTDALTRKELDSLASKGWFLAPREWVMRVGGAFEDDRGRVFALARTSFLPSLGFVPPKILAMGHRERGDRILVRLMTNASLDEAAVFADWLLERASSGSVVFESGVLPMGQLMSKESPT